MQCSARDTKPWIVLRTADVHAHHDLHRGPAAGGPPQGAARLLRLRRGRLLFAGDVACQSAGPRAHQAAPARAGRRVATQPDHHHHRREGCPPARARPDRTLRHAARRRRDPRLPGGAGRGHSVHALHHVDLLDRGRGGGGRQAVLVPALRDAGPRVHQGADRARRRGEMQRAGAHRRPAGAGPAPLRHPQRHDRAARDQARQSHRHRHQAGLGALDPQGQTQDLRQSRRSRARHGERDLAGAMDREPVRSDAELEGRRVGREACGRASSSSRAFSTSRTPGPRSRPAPARSSYPTTAAASSTARRRRSRRCRRSSTRWAATSR